MTRKNAAAITVHSSQPPCNLWSEWRRGRARRPFRFRRKGRSLPARQIFQPRRLGASGSRGRRRRRKGLEGRRAQGGGRGRFEGVGVFSRRVVESVSGLEPNAGEDRTPRRNSVEGNTWSKTSLHTPWRLSTLDREVNFERIPEIQMEHNGATVFKSTWLEFVLSILSVDTHTSHVCPRIFDTLVQKSNANWIFASKREREKGRKARSACNLRLVGRDAGERVPLVSRSFLNSGREERGATRSRGRGRLLATTRPFARRLGPPLLASCRPTTASVCFRALVCASSGATVALLLYRPIRTFVLAPSLSLALEPTTWRPFGTASGGVRVMREQEFYYGRGPYRGIVRDSWGMRVQFFATVEKMKWMEDRLEFVWKVFFNGNGMFEIWRFRELNLIENVHRVSLGKIHWVFFIFESR